MNDGHYQVMVRPVKWRWYNMFDRIDKHSGYRKIYRRWVLRGPVEFREFCEPTPKQAKRKARPGGVG